MQSVWDHTFLNCTLREWSIALLIILLSITVLRILQTVVLRRLKRISTRTKTTLDDFLVQQIQGTIMPFLYLLSIYAGVHYLNLSEKAVHIAGIALLIAIVFFSLKFIYALLSQVFDPITEKKERSVNRASRGVILIIRIIIFIAALLFVIDNLGYDITTLIAGLGIGGIAIALASQTVLADLFSYLAIFFDKPFETGDFIVLDDKMGTVEYIGIRTTRLRTLNGDQLVCSNKDLTSSRVHNYKRMQERRSEFTFGLVYDTPLEKLRAIPSWIKIIIESIPSTRFDRAHFKTFGESSLQFEVVYIILSPDYKEYMNIQQQINLLLFELFEKESVEFAFPTQKILLDKNISGSIKVPGN
jgi:small-conductance mechanosensitive channel